MPLIPAFHETYGWCLIPDTKVRLHSDVWSTYNPAEHNADDVVAYLQGAGPRERERVLAAERARPRPRKTVMALAEHPAAEPPVDSVDEAHNATIPDAVGAGDPTPTGTTPGDTSEDRS